jgi:AraC-like DNA-binding protein
MVRPLYESVPQMPTESFHCEEIRGRSFGTPWHVHPECELTLTLKGYGTRIVGDHIATLAPGDLVFVAADLPHVWQQDATRDRQALHAVVVQFRSGFLGTTFWDAPELESVRKLIARGAVGLEVTGETRTRATELIRGLLLVRGMERLLGLLKILHVLGEAKELRTLSSPGFRPVLDEHDERRVSRVTRYIQEHLGEPLYAREVARQAWLSEGSFTRFFKTRTGMTFPHYVTELRIGRACRMLAHSERPIAQIAHDCGFTNLAHFNRQFRRLRGETPRGFRRRIAGEESKEAVG